MVKKVTRKPRNNRIEGEYEDVPSQEAAVLIQSPTPRDDTQETPEVADADAPHPSGLTEEQMRENIRAGARGLRDLVDKYQEQHRVMQEEVAEAIIRDVQEQNQLHRLTANVLRAQQASLQNPEYTRWAYANKKGEFGPSYDVGRDDGSDERGHVPDEDIASNKSESRSPSYATTGHSKSGSPKKGGNPDTYDNYVSESNRWMKRELQLFSAKETGHKTISIDIDALGDRATLGYIKGYNRVLIDGEQRSDVISKVPLPPSAVLSPVIPPAEKALRKLREYFAISTATASGISDNESASSLCFVLFINGTILWPLETSTKVDDVVATVKSHKSVATAYPSPLNVYSVWLQHQLAECFSPPQGCKSVPILFSPELQEDAEQIGNRRKVGDHVSNLSLQLAFTLDVAAKALVAGDGIPMLREEGNLLTIVPFPITKSSTTAFQCVAIVRTFSFSGITKAVEVVNVPQNANPLQTVQGLRTFFSGVATEVDKAERTESTSVAVAQHQRPKPSNIVRTFVVQMSDATGDSNENFLLTGGMVRLLDARPLSPSIPFAAYAGALCWTDLCGLARTEFGIR